MDWVYIACAKGSKLGPVKIGISTNLRARMRTLSTSSAQEIECYAFYDGFGNALQYEAAAHRRLSSRRLNGEWFDITPAEATEEVAAAIKSLGVALESGVEMDLPIHPKTETVPWETVSLQLDPAVLDVMRDEWTNWQARINAILRAHLGL